MPSTMVKNALPAGLMRMAGNYALDCWFPPEDLDGIATAQNVALGALNLDGAMVKSLVANGRCLLTRPASPNFTFSASTDACTIEMAGSDQWGRDVVWTIVKGATGTVVKTLVSAGARIPPMWRIDSIRIVSVTTGAGTVSVGFNYASGTTQSLTLPMSFPNWAAVQGATRLIYIEDLGGNWSGGPWPGFPTTSLVNDNDAVRGVVPLVIGTTLSANITAATFTNATLTLSKTGAFASYTWQSGDTVTIVSGTGVTPGSYAIGSRTSDNAIVLEADIGGANPADVVFTLTSVPTTWGRMRLLLDPDLLVNQ